MTYKTKGTCSTQIDFDIVDNKLRNVKYTNGCQGNLKGICKLVEGMEVDRVIALLKGIDCGGKGTSCPDQLAKALIEASKK